MDLSVYTKLEADGSGLRTFESIEALDLDTGGIINPTSKPFGEQFADREGLRLEEVIQDTIENGNTRYIFVYSFDDLSAFEDESLIIKVDKSDNKLFISEMHFPKQSPMLEDNQLEMVGGMMMGFLAEGFDFTYTIEMPYKITKTNADEIDDNKAIWKRTLGEYYNDGLLVEIECELPLKKSWWQRMCFFF